MDALRWAAVTGEIVPAGQEPVEGVVVGSPADEVVPYESRGFLTQADIDHLIDDPDEVLETIRSRLSDNTWRAYKLAWANFLRWCAANRGRTPLPATLETILSYLRYLQKCQMADGTVGVSPSTMRTFLAAAKRWHGYGNPPPEWYGGHQSVSDFVVGYTKKRARDPLLAPKRAAGARTVIMRALLDATPVVGARHIRDRAVLLLGYTMAARRSELAALDVSASLRWTQDGLEVYIASAKNDQMGEGAWVAIPEHPSMAEKDPAKRLPQYCPVRAVEAWMAVRNAAIGSAGPLFVPVDQHGNIRVKWSKSQERPNLSGSAFEVVMADAVWRAWRAAEQAGDAKIKRLINPENVKLTPHSLRRGWATDARASGWDVLDISRGGRWSPQSKVVYIYIEEADRWLRHQLKPVAV